VGDNMALFDFVWLIAVCFRHRKKLPSIVFVWLGGFFKKKKKKKYFILRPL